MVRSNGPPLLVTLGRSGVRFAAPSMITLFLLTISQSHLPFACMHPIVGAFGSPAHPQSLLLWKWVPLCPNVRASSSVAHGNMVPAYGVDETENFNERLARPARSKKTGFCDAPSGLSKSQFFCHVYAPRIRGFPAWSTRGVKVEHYGMRPCLCADGLAPSRKGKTDRLGCLPQDHGLIDSLVAVTMCCEHQIHGKDNPRSAKRRLVGPQI
jgi:hypothetical protein